MLRQIASSSLSTGYSSRLAVAARATLNKTSRSPVGTTVIGGTVPPMETVELPQYPFVLQRDVEAAGSVGEAGHIRPGLGEQHRVGEQHQRLPSFAARRADPLASPWEAEAPGA